MENTIDCPHCGESFTLPGRDDISKMTDAEKVHSRTILRALSPLGLTDKEFIESLKDPDVLDQIMIKIKALNGTDVDREAIIELITEFAISCEG